MTIAVVAVWYLGLSAGYTTKVSGVSNETYTADQRYSLRSTLPEHQLGRMETYENHARGKLLFGVSPDVARDHDETEYKADRLEIGEPQRDESRPFGRAGQVGETGGCDDANDIAASTADDSAWNQTCLAYTLQFANRVAIYPAPMTPTIWNTFRTTSRSVTWNGVKPRSLILRSVEATRFTHMTVLKLDKTPVGILVAKVAINKRYVLGSSNAALTWLGLNFLDLIPTIPEETLLTAMYFCSSDNHQAFDGESARTK